MKLTNILTEDISALCSDLLDHFRLDHNVTHVYDVIPLEPNIVNRVTLMIAQAYYINNQIGLEQTKITIPVHSQDLTIDYQVMDFFEGDNYMPFRHIRGLTMDILGITYRMYKNASDEEVDKKLNEWYEL